MNLIVKGLPMALTGCIKLVYSGLKRSHLT
jgi:hypothetical protein